MNSDQIDVYYLHYNAIRNKTVTNGATDSDRLPINWVYPGRMQHICAGQMGNHLFHVLCNHDVMLEA